ncbi:MAG: ComEC/Rec2 family competence protein [Proteobacteria bacterium]|nr:ComEC/Rec2 family competence protein [Pseudomonadota bacterium]
MLNKTVNIFLEERERWLLWLPVFMGLGVALYFTGHVEPPLWPAPALSIVLLAAAIFLRHTAFLPVLLVLLMVALGFSAAKLETLVVAQPMLHEDLKNVDVQGRVVSLSHLDEGYRILVAQPQVSGLAPEKTPSYLRVKFIHSTKLPRLGSWVTFKAMLFPLSGPIEPGAFNFRRFAFFSDYGGTGFALGYWRYADGPPPSLMQEIALFFERLRVEMARKIRAHDDSRETAVAVALVNGDQAGIPKGTLTAMRISGISHILSVSGLHIAMVAGAVFFALRALMALWPWLALHWPIKKIAAGAALLAAVFYTLICAAPVPAVRSTLMTGLVLLAMMVDRRALSMRLVAFAAFVCLLVSPASMLDVSFQMSFAAVTALIAAFEHRENALLNAFKGQSWLGRIGFYLAGSVLTSLVASAATAPFILYYFQQVNWYGVLTNLIAVPLSSFIIMPAGVVAVLLMPFGWEAGPLWVMREGIHWMLKSAEWVATFPGSVTYHPAMDFGFLLAVTAGGLWLCLWQNRWRFLSAVPLLVGTLGFLFTIRPDVLIAEDGITLAARAADGNLIVRAEHLDDFEVNAWRQRDGHQGVNGPYPLDWFEVAKKGGEGPLSCTGYDCVYTKAGHAIAFPMSDAAIAAACGQGEVIVAALVESACLGKTVINRDVTHAKGSHAIYISEQGLRIQTALDEKNKRLWE